MAILDDAKEAVFGERQQTYGHPLENFMRAARMVEAYLAARPMGTLRAQDVPLIMILIKIARLMETPNHKDSVVDIAGYAQAYARTVGIDP